MWAQRERGAALQQSTASEGVRAQCSDSPLPLVAAAHRCIAFGRRSEVSWPLETATRPQSTVAWEGRAEGGRGTEAAQRLASSDHDGRNASIVRRRIPSTWSGERRAGAGRRTTEPLLSINQARSPAESRAEQSRGEEQGVALARIQITNQTHSDTRSTHHSHSHPSDSLSLRSPPTWPPKPLTSITPPRIAA